MKRIAFVVLVLAGCTPGPEYERPSVAVPAAFKEGGSWKRAEPRDHMPREAWWQVFGDPVLDALEGELASANLDLVIAAANYRQATATAKLARAGLYPQASVNAGVTRSRQGTGRSATTWDLAGEASWEIDLFGRLRRGVEAGDAAAEASAADLEAVRLLVRSELATDYFQLRIVDAQRQLLEDTVAAYQRSLQLVRNRNAAGVAARAEVVLAEAQLEAARAQALDVQVARAQLEHAIAVLLGKAPSDFALERAPLVARVPEFPLAMPSEVLELRPDIGAAERRVAAANAQVGVASSAWYPVLSLSASGGYRSTSFGDWLTAPARFWSFGPALVQTIFDGGARSARSEGARAAWEATVAEYRRTVLASFAEVEDQLAALRILAAEAVVEDAAVRAARESLALTTNQYQAGTVSYLDVVTVQAVALANERNAVAIRGRQLVAAVQLVKAIGGAWPGL